MELRIRNIELWTDSFHEGDWAARGLSGHWGSPQVTYVCGFIPQFKFRSSESEEIVLTVFGSYRSWSPLPSPIEELLKWGKPDLVVYDSDAKKIIFASEETAAVPTGNQSLQRCERLYGAQKNGVPFIYLLAEYGMHVDQGVRRASIWPTLQALALTVQSGILASVVHYGDKGTPHSYEVGEGWKSYIKTLWLILRRWLGENVTDELETETTGQYSRMLGFVDSQWRDMVFFLPDANLYKDVDNVASKALSFRATGSKIADKLKGFTTWPKTAGLPAHVRAKQGPLTFQVPDQLLTEVSKLIVAGRAYCLTDLGGSRPLPEAALTLAINAQRRLFLSDERAKKEAFSLDLHNFPKTANGRRHVITATRILFQLDSTRDFQTALKAAFGERDDDVFEHVVEDMPLFLFVSNSITPGRIFGDPYTGQIAAFVPIFARDSESVRSRISIAYYPHQAHPQFTSRLKSGGKGIQIMRELLDFAVFHAGVAVRM